MTAEQLDLFARASDEAREDGDWTYYLGLPDRSGTAAYLHLARWHGDPPERVARGGEARASHRGEWIERLGDAEWWAARIEAHLADGESRTWNRICVELEGVTADAMFDCAADAGLWLLVERRRVGWACEEGCVFFLHADFIALDARDELRVACPVCRVPPGTECRGGPPGWVHGVRGGVAAAWLAMEHEALGVELDVIDRMHPPGSAHRRWIEGADARECFPKAFGSRRKNADGAAEAA